MNFSALCDSIVKRVEISSSNQVQELLIFYMPYG